MNTNEIVEEAKKRLAEIEAEAARLRAIIAAADGHAPAPPIQTVPVFVPCMVPQPMPYERHAPSLPWLDGPNCDPITTGTILFGPSFLPGIINDTEDREIVYGPGPRLDTTTVFGSH